MSERESALVQVFSGRILRRSLVVAVVVGTALNAINQGDAILVGGPVVAWKLGLTYVVPFFVASYGAWNGLRGSDSTSTPNES